MYVYVCIYFIMTHIDVDILLQMKCDILIVYLNISCDFVI